jgi:DnaJ-domain-containing protein 1
LSIPRRLGRFARGFVSNLNDERLKQTIRIGRERGETLKDACGAAWRGITEECASETSSSSVYNAARRFPVEVLAAYHRLGLGAGSPLEEVRKRRRELIKRHHPDRFAKPEYRDRAERLSAEINAAHDTIERHLLRR